MITVRPWVAAIADRPWLAGALISGATTVLIVGLLAVTQPDKADPIPTNPSLVSARDQQPDAGMKLPVGDLTVPSPTTSAAKPKSTAKAKPQPKVTTTKPKPKTSAPAKTGAGGAGAGRIQFGKTYTGRATFYDADGSGNCSFDKSSDLMVGAMNQQDYGNSQACGAHLKVTGPNGTVTIRVVDRCPECPPGAIDLSQQAFAKIAPVSAGRVSISWKLLSPGGLGSIGYRYKSGSSQYWCGIQVLDHRNPVKSLAVKAGGSWVTLDRQDYNYFVAAGGAGCGGAIRVTDIYGNQVTDDGIKISPDRIQRGDSQFPAR